MRPEAAALPRTNEKIEKGMYGSAMPKTPANGFTIIARVKPGRAATIRAYAASVEKTVQESPHILASLRLHYLRWVLFDNDTRFMYIGIFDTDFDKYVDDAVMLFKQSGITTVFEQLEGFPKTGGRTRPPSPNSLGSPSPIVHGICRVSQRHGRGSYQSVESKTGAFRHVDQMQ